MQMLLVNHLHIEQKARVQVMTPGVPPGLFQAHFVACFLARERVTKESEKL